MKKVLIGLLVVLIWTPTILAEEASYSPEEKYYNPMARFRMNLFAGVGEGILSTSSSGFAERINFEENLGMDSTRTTPDVEFALKLSQEAEFYVNGFLGAFPGLENIESSITLDGKTFNAGEEVASYQVIQSLETGFLFTAVGNSQGYFQLGFGLRYLSYKSRLDSEAQGEAEWKEEALMPTLRFKGDVRISGFLFLYGDLTIGGVDYEYLKTSDSNTSGTSKKEREYFFLRSQAGLKFALVPGVDLYAGYVYQQIHINEIEGDDRDKVIFKFHGGVISLEVLF